MKIEIQEYRQERILADRVVFYAKEGAGVKYYNILQRSRALPYGRILISTFTEPNIDEGAVVAAAVRYMKRLNPEQKKLYKVIFNQPKTNPAPYEA